MICGVVNERPVSISNLTPAGMVHIKDCQSMWCHAIEDQNLNVML